MESISQSNQVVLDTTPSSRNNLYVKIVNLKSKLLMLGRQTFWLELQLKFLRTHSNITTIKRAYVYMHV